MRLRIIALVLALTLAVALLCIGGASAQQTPPAKKPRPKIGLALEGGGALGLAHIAVLQWLDDHHIPVDYIAGTSMGALVGGMYATGKSPRAINAEVIRLSAEDLISGENHFPDLSFRRKEEQRAYLNSLQFGVRIGLHLPAGLTTGQNINYVLAEVALPYSYLESFDDLPTPFRCVATELVNGEKKVFDRGSLSEAMRASMSLPGVFSPVRIGQNVYVDGGLVDNLPTDVVKEMGADIIIAVHLQKATPRPEDVQSIVDVLQGTIEAVIRTNEREGMKKANVVINVNLAGYHSTSYDQRHEIEQLGKKAVEEMSAELMPLHLEDADWEEYLAQRKSRIIRIAPPPQKIVVEGAAPGPQVEIEGRLNALQLTGQPLDQEKLQNALSDLNSDGRFTRFDYRMQRTPVPDTLAVRTQEPGYKGKRIRAGFGLDGAQPDEVQFSLGAGITFLDLGGLHSDLRIDLAAGSTYRASSEYFHPFTPESRWFVAPRAEISSKPLNLYSHNSITSAYRVYQGSVAVDFGYSINRSSELRFGYEIGALHDALRIGAATLPSVRGRFGAASVRFRLERVDDPIVPRQGVAWDIAFRWFDTYPGATRSFPLAETHFGVYQKVFGRGTVFFTTAGGTTFGRGGTGLPQFFLGGPERLSAYGSNELQTNQYFLFRGGYLHEVFRLSPLVGKAIYVTAAFEGGKVYGVPSASRFPNDFASGILIETILGPAFFGGSVGDTGHRKWYFQLGHIF
jgi:NTE family protein